MKTIITTFFVFLILFGKAQTPTEKCWTPEMDTSEFSNLPWYDNNDFLENFLDSIGYPSTGSTSRIVGAPVRFKIPIKFWIYRDDNGNGGPDAREIRTMMDDLNRRYNQTNNAMIGFYMKCQPTFVNNSTHLIKTFTGASLLMAANNEPACINVHIIGSFNQAGIAGFSLMPLNASMIPAGAYTNPNANGDLAHEIGHVLGLVHTHQYSHWNWKCLTESVSRTRKWPTFNLCIKKRLISKVVCESTGDGLRDTQADNDLIDNNSCNYNVIFGNDVWGDSYDNPPAGVQDRPNINNIMSYNSATNCVDQFSRLQIAVMLYTLYVKKTINAAIWSKEKYTFDSFEPDNEPLAARNIIIADKQERNFHQSANSISNIPYSTQCDVDWVRFVAPCTRNLTIATSTIANKTNANTRLTLFNNTLDQLIQNDDISSTNQFSSLNWNFVAGQVYFIRVENMQNLVTGYYNLLITVPTINYAITGTSTPCINSANTYQISPAPATGTFVNWTIYPNDGTVTITPSTTGFAVDADMTNATLGQVYTLTATTPSICQTISGNTQFLIPAIPFSGTVTGLVGWNPYFTNPLVEGDNYLYLYGTPYGANFFEVNIGDYLGTAFTNGNWVYVSGDYVGNGNPTYLYFDTYSTSFSDAYYDYHYTDACGSHTLHFHFSTVYAYPPNSRIQITSEPKPKLKLSPNPTSNYVNISISDVKTKSKVGKNIDFVTTKLISIYDKFGNLQMKISKEIPKEGLQLNVTTLKPNEVYTIIVEDKKGLKLNGKLIKL